MAAKVLQFCNTNQISSVGKDSHQMPNNERFINFVCGKCIFAIENHAFPCLLYPIYVLLSA